MPLFSKRHHEGTATILKHRRPMVHGTPKQFPTGYYLELAKRTQWEEMCLHFADMFEADNTKFNAKEFLITCGCMDKNGSVRSPKQGGLLY